MPRLESVNFITNHKTKTIENRKILIENFLQKVLSSEQVIESKNQKKILELLGLPPHFYELPDTEARPYGNNRNGSGNGAENVFDHMARLSLECAKEEKELSESQQLHCSNS
jgi:hypothetical protein